MRTRSYRTKDLSATAGAPAGYRRSARLLRETTGVAVSCFPRRSSWPPSPRWRRPATQHGVVRSPAVRVGHLLDELAGQRVDDVRLLAGVVLRSIISRRCGGPDTSTGAGGRARRGRGRRSACGGNRRGAAPGIRDGDGAHPDSEAPGEGPAELQRPLLLENFTDLAHGESLGRHRTPFACGARTARWTIPRRLLRRPPPMSPGAESPVHDH